MRKTTRKAICFLCTIALASSLLVLTGCGVSAPAPFKLQNGEAVVSRVDTDPGFSVFSNATGTTSTGETAIAVWVKVKVPNGEELTDFSGAARELEALCSLETANGAQIPGTNWSSNSISDDEEGTVWNFQLVFAVSKDIDPYSLVFCAGDTRSQLAYFKDK